MSIELLLGLIALLTSMVASVIGFGGGMLLIAILPLFLSANIIIPVHGITQIASSSSRMFFSLSHVQWQLFPKFFIGSVAGTLLFGVALFNMPTDYVPVAIGTYIILNLWVPVFSQFISRFESYYLIGLLQTGLGLVVGATGPLCLSVLTKNLSSKDQIIATSSLFMAVSHMAKIPVYLSITSFLSDSLLLIVLMVTGSIMGAYIGTRLRLKVNNEKLVSLMKLLLSALAVHMIVRAFWF